ncbi:hypothetical protein CEXT_240671 [Caerostris extrusa]|uniref:RNase H type-1 domain-containing protein n=1 Tax=Caerostris extrusa TaxID=172846 RepID=A0AAV4PBY9_CAEEX|nr:hypothetical protein CEXT_240671 [Caerostris extrusa]
MTVGDRTGASMLKEISVLSQRQYIHIQWILSQAVLRGNEEADSLEKSATLELMIDHHALTFSEIFTLRKIAANKLWADTSERNLELLLLLKATDKYRLPSFSLPLVIFDASSSTIMSKISLLFPK